MTTGPEAELLGLQLSAPHVPALGLGFICDIFVCRNFGAHDLNVYYHYLIESWASLTCPGLCCLCVITSSVINTQE